MGYTWSLTGTMMVDPLSKFDSGQIPNIAGPGFLSREDFASFSVITVFGNSVVEIYLASQDVATTEYQHDEDIIRAYSVPLIVSEAGQIGLFGDEVEGDFLKFPPELIR